MAAPPPPPPDGFVGVYHPSRNVLARQDVEPTASSSSTAASALTSTAWSALRGAAAVAGTAAALAGTVAVKAASTAATQASELDQRYEVSKTASTKLGEVGEACARKVSLATPEDRQRWHDGAVTVISLASVFGGPKARALAGAANFAMAVAVAPSTSAVPDATDAHASHGGAQPPAVAATAAASSGCELRPSDRVSEVVRLEVVATAAAGQSMRIHIEGEGDFEVVVPAGVQIGESFVFEIEVSDSSGAGAMAAGAACGPSSSREAVPIGQPAVPLAD